MGARKWSANFIGFSSNAKPASGTVILLTKLQGADRTALSSFRKPPSIVTVNGPIVAVDAVKRTVTIKAVSTSFEQ